MSSLVSCAASWSVAVSISLLSFLLFGLFTSVMMFVEAAESGSTARSHGSTSGAHLGPHLKIHGLAMLRAEFARLSE